MDEDPEHDITVTHLREAPTDCEGPLRKAIEATLHRHGVSQAQISVALVDDQRIADLNDRHLGQAGPTDVLAFDLHNAERGSERDLRSTVGGGVASNGPAPLVDGEIVVSVDTATREAARRGLSVNAELALYAVHGVLHLLGYDDKEAPGAARMHELEDQILDEIGIGAVYRAEPK